MIKRVINKMIYLLFEQPSFARLAVNKHIPEALNNLGNAGVTVEIGAGEEQTLRKHLKDDSKYYSLNLLFNFKPNIVADALIMPFDDSTIDNIILVEVLEHIPNPELLLKECFRVLKPGGALVGSTRFIIYEHAAPYDYFRFTKDALDLFLKNFEDVSVKKLGNKFHVIMDLLSEKWPVLRILNQLLAKITFKSGTCYNGLLFIAKK